MDWGHGEGIAAPRRFRYMRFTGICLAIFGASIGLIHGDLRWAVWGLTALVALLMLALGERGVRRWRLELEASASSEQEAQLDQLRIQERIEVRQVLRSVAAFIVVLFIRSVPLPGSGYGSWLCLAWRSCSGRPAPVADRFN